MGWLDSLFDLDGDGEVTMLEEISTLDMLGFFDEEEETHEADPFSEDDEFSDDF